MRIHLSCDSIWPLTLMVVLKFECLLFTKTWNLQKKGTSWYIVAYLRSGQQHVQSHMVCIMGLIFSFYRSAVSIENFIHRKDVGTFGFLSYVHWCVGAHTGSVKFQVSVSCIPGISKTENVLLASTSLLLVWQCHEPVYNFIDATTCLWPCGCIRVCLPGVNQVSQLVYIRHESVTLTTAPFCFSYRGGFSSLCKEISGIS